MSAHINRDGEFQSDKYPACPAGKVPLSTKDPTAQDLLWEYAQRRREVDSEFADDLEVALRSKGYVPKSWVCGTCHATDDRGDICPDCANRMYPSGERDARLTALEAAARALVEALPKCSLCGALATGEGGGEFGDPDEPECDKHGGDNYEYAAPLRALLALLASAAPESAAEGKTSATVPPEREAVVAFLQCLAGEYSIGHDAHDEANALSEAAEQIACGDHLKAAAARRSDEQRESVPT